MYKPTAKQLLDTLSTAVDGGIAHWCSTDTGQIRKIRINAHNGVTTSIDFESVVLCKGWDFFCITPILLAQTIDKLQNGEYEFAKETSTMRQLLEQEGGKDWRLDAEAADVIVQFAAFGQFIFAGGVI